MRAITVQQPWAWACMHGGNTFGSSERWGFGRPRTSGESVTQPSAADARSELFVHPNEKVVRDHPRLVTNVGVSLGEYQGAKIIESRHELVKAGGNYAADHPAQLKLAGAKLCAQILEVREGRREKSGLFRHLKSHNRATQEARRCCPQRCAALPDACPSLADEHPKECDGATDKSHQDGHRRSVPGFDGGSDLFGNAP